MIKLDNASSAWYNYFLTVTNYHSDLPRLMTVESLSKMLSDYNGVVVDPADGQGWQPYFKTEQALTYFVLKWS